MLSFHLTQLAKLFICWLHTVCDKPGMWLQFWRQTSVNWSHFAFMTTNLKWGLRIIQPSFWSSLINLLSNSEVTSQLLSPLTFSIPLSQANKKHHNTARSSLHYQISTTLSFLPTCSFFPPVTIDCSHCYLKPNLPLATCCIPCEFHILAFHFFVFF